MDIIENKSLLVNRDPIPGLLITPPIDKDWWLLKVHVSPTQAIIAFPKFGIVGMGFLVEKEDWNTNLPAKTDPHELLDHIRVNKGDDSISDEDCIAAIRMIQERLNIIPPPRRRRDDY